MWRRVAGFWGPLSFAAGAIAAGTRQPGYSHRTNHVSGLAARGESSAALMVPGFLVLAAAELVLPAPTSALRRLYRTAAATTFVAGVIRVSDPTCPQPGSDPKPKASDLGHGVGSITTFVLWAAAPLVAVSGQGVPRWYRRLARGLAVPTLGTFVLAGATTKNNSQAKGLAQRAFLATVFVLLAGTGMANGPRQGNTPLCERSSSRPESSPRPGLPTT